MDEFFTLARAAVHAVSDIEIRWTPDPLPRLERVSASDLLTLDPGDLLEHAFSLQEELESVRALLHEALGALTRVSGQRDRALKIIEELRAVVRTRQAAS